MKIQISISSIVYRYAMVNRPPGIGCNPKEGFVRVDDRPAKGHDHYDMARNGIAVYNRKLTDHETKQYEMAYLADGKDRDDIAKDVAEDLKDYAQGYVRRAEREPDEFVQTCLERLKDITKGYRPSVGNLNEFALLVLKHLRLM